MRAIAVILASLIVIVLAGCKGKDLHREAVPKPVTATPVALPGKCVPMPKDRGELDERYDLDNDGTPDTLFAKEGECHMFSCPRTVYVHRGDCVHDVGRIEMPYIATIDTLSRPNGLASLKITAADSQGELMELDYSFEKSGYVGGLTLGMDPDDERRVKVTRPLMPFKLDPDSQIKIHACDKTLDLSREDAEQWIETTAVVFPSSSSCSAGCCDLSASDGAPSADGRAIVTKVCMPGGRANELFTTCSSRPRTKPPVPTPIAITLTGDHLTINSKSFDAATSTTTFEQLFGKSDRMSPIHHIYSWDQLGVGVYADESGHVKMFAVWFDQQEPFMSRRPFMGRLDIAGTSISRQTLLGQVARIPESKQGPIDNTLVLDASRHRTNFVADHAGNLIYIQIGLPE